MIRRIFRKFRCFFTEGRSRKLFLYTGRLKLRKRLRRPIRYETQLVYKLVLHLAFFARSESVLTRAFCRTGFSRSSVQAASLARYSNSSSASRLSSRKG